MNTIDEMFAQAMTEHKEKQAQKSRQKEKEEQEEAERRQKKRKEIDGLFESARRNLTRLTRSGKNAEFRRFLQCLFEQKAYRVYSGTNRNQTSHFHLIIPRENVCRETGDDGSIEICLVWEHGSDVKTTRLEIYSVESRSGITQYSHPSGPTLDHYFYPDARYELILLKLSKPESAIKLLIEQL